MSQTTSLSFPYMFDPARNMTGVLDDQSAITSRVRLLLLTEPTEIYNEPDQGGGLRRFLWQYNTPTTRGLIEDHIREQLRKHEPCVDPDKTVFSEGLLFTDSQSTDDHKQEFQKMKMTVGLRTIYGDNITVEADASQLGPFDAAMPTGIFDGKQSN